MEKDKEELIYDEAGLDFTEILLKDYENYFLLKNPFPSITVPHGSVEVLVDRKDVMNGIREIISYYMQSKESSIALMVGAYGNGKSHLLKYIEKKINSQLGHYSRSRDKVYAAYIQSPGKNFLEFYTNFIESFGLTFFADLINNLLYEERLYSFTIDKDLEYDLNQEIIPDKLKNMFKSLGILPSERIIITKEKVDNWKITDEETKNSYILKKENERLDIYVNWDRMALSNVIEDNELISALISLNTENKRAIAWRWLLGESLRQNEKALINVSSQISDTNKAMRIMLNLIKLFHLNSTLIILLLDELEQITLLSSNLSDKFYNDLRHFIDSCPSGICLIATITPSAWDSIENAGHPLARRLKRNVFWLDPFGDKRTLELLKAYLALGRTLYINKKGGSWEDIKQKIKKDYPDIDPLLYPFSNKSVSMIREFAVYQEKDKKYEEEKAGNISEILRILGILIDRGAEKGIIFDEKEKISQVLKEGD